MNEPEIPEMTRRSTQIFNEIVKNYLQTGSPVGSGIIAAASEVNLSSASVRAIMAELEGSGLLFSPHTSAGRVPTGRACAVCRRADGSARQSGSG